MFLKPGNLDPSLKGEIECGQGCSKIDKAKSIDEETDFQLVNRGKLGKTPTPGKEQKKQLRNIESMQKKVNEF